MNENGSYTGADTAADEREGRCSRKAEAFPAGLERLEQLGEGAAIGVGEERLGIAAGQLATAADEVAEPPVLVLLERNQSPTKCLLCLMLRYLRNKKGNGDACSVTAKHERYGVSRHRLHEKGQRAKEGPR